MPDPKKKSNEVTVRGDLLSDRLAAQVHRKEITRAEAERQQRIADKIVEQTKKVGYKTSGSSQKTSSQRKYHKARFRFDKDGNKEAY